MALDLKQLRKQLTEQNKLRLAQCKAEEARTKLHLKVLRLFERIMGYIFSLDRNDYSTKKEEHVVDVCCRFISKLYAIIPDREGLGYLRECVKSGEYHLANEQLKKVGKPLGFRIL